MQEKKIIYFDRPGRQNTEAVAEAVRERCGELGIKHIVFASDSGKTALKFWKVLQGKDLELISVAEHTGYSGGDEPTVKPEKRKELEEKGIKVLVCSHALSGIGRSITDKFGGVSHVEIIAYTLRLFGTDGLKVAVEVAVMAADAGLIPSDRVVIAAGGSGGGADTAVVLKPAHMNNFFELEIREIIAKPRQRFH